MRQSTSWKLFKTNANVRKISTKQGLRGFLEHSWIWFHFEEEKKMHKGEVGNQNLNSYWK